MVVTAIMLVMVMVVLVGDRARGRARGDGVMVVVMLMGVVHLADLKTSHTLRSTAHIMQKQR